MTDLRLPAGRRSSTLRSDMMARDRSKPFLAIAWPYMAYAALIGLAFLTLIPIIWMVLTSFKSSPEVAASPPTWFPHSWHPENYRDAWNAAPFGRYLANTVIVAGSVMILETVTSALAAYAFARLRFPGRDIIFLTYLGTLMIPRQVTLIPQFILMRELGWIDTYQGLIIPQAFSAFGTFLLRQYFIGIPRELEDAARIDGASRWEIFRRIILPLSGPALATLAVFIFLYQWNNLLWPLVMSNSESTRPVAVGLRAFQGQYATDWNLLMAAAGLATLPVVAMYVVAQRWFVRGITLSGFGGR
ncbi:MAG: carbohydrate ABC transporter permease [Chloroflexota bacterium]|nr:carbohydrate ABC transporter permease [Chloroflexota bacterium]